MGNFYIIKWTCTAYRIPTINVENIDSLENIVLIVINFCLNWFSRWLYRDDRIVSFPISISSTDNNAHILKNIIK